ncbi:MAG: monovalent cation/H(+) antiporter subunit G [Chloroflexi bacterium]|nr:monovalent cation/H(+) antiporter subunit G [Chloroflexota bacterium]MBM3182498.1 monovalent cation/H(+) antiporter subunit G [Chloroflexota bacterium]MBM4452005.1 monovalent cation/H(+) antiporter subunit G [Chloroflexota bacterium]MBM4453485.1 monovalent cation/H(+) antiporter subunit G [Chloroflexota bacterium]
MIQFLLAAIFILGGLFFLAVGSTGIIRLPDVYCRSHAVSKSETLGSMLLLGGLALYHGFEINSAKLVLILLFIALTNPTATHVIARAAARSGLQPWVQERNGEILWSSNSTEIEQSQGGDMVEDKEA